VGTEGSADSGNLCETASDRTCGAIGWSVLFNRHYRQPVDCSKEKVNAMGKNMDTKKDVKKKPAKSIKEKRAEKKSKKETKS